MVTGRSSGSAAAERSCRTELDDPAELERFYGKDSAAGRLPKRENVEEVPKNEVMAALDGATRRTRKGRYHKIHHAPLILENLESRRVRSRAPHCERLFRALLQVLA